MNNLVNCTSTILCALVAFMGCSERAQLIKTEPRASDIDYFESELKLYFDKPVLTVRVNNVPAQPIYNPPTTDWKMSLRQVEALWLRPGKNPAQEVCLFVSYTDESGIHEHDLCNWLPETIAEAPTPEIVESSVENGDIGVDPAQLNTNGITLRFSEDVAGSIEIRNEAGTSLGWIARWSENKFGDSVTIFPPAGKELINGTSYVIQINLYDAGGSRLDEVITFTTKD